MKKSSSNSKLIVIAAILVVAVIGMAGLYHINGDSFDMNGRQAVLVTTDSMDGDVTEYSIDSFPADTLVMIKHIPDSQKRFLRAGDVISYYNDNGVLVHHRIIQADDGFVYVHGDNNTATEKVLFEDINGKVVGTSWIAGHVIAFISDNLPMILAGLFVLSSILAVREVYRRDKEGKGNARKLATSVVVVMVLAVSFTGIGYAAGYHGWTTNDDNVVTSEYVTMVQTNYTFTNNDIRFDTLETEAGISYRLLGTCQELITIDGKKYYGVEIGQDTLKAVRTGGTGDVDVTVSTLGLDDSWFTDYSGQLQDWRYVLRITGGDPVTTQYAYYDGKLNGSGEGVWKYKSSSDTVIEKLTLKDNTEYTTKLYFAGAGEYSGASFRSAGEDIKVPETVTVYPRWLPAEGNDTYKCVLQSSDGLGATECVMFVAAGSTMVLPENMFTEPTGKVFVGWRGEDGKIFGPWHAYENYNRDRTFTAQWVESGSALKHTVTYAAGGGAGTMATQYVLAGSTYTLPMCAFANISSGSLVVPAKTTSMPVTVYNSANEQKTVNLADSGCTVGGATSFTVPAKGSTTVTVVKNVTNTDVTVSLAASGCTVNYKFSGWEITADDSSPDRDYSKFTGPFQDIPELSENITLTPKWTAVTDKSRMVVMQNLPQAPTKTYTVFTQENGIINLPHCIFSPPGNLDNADFEGWQFIGWSVYKTAGSNVPQSYIMPIGDDGCIVKNGTIKFVYQNDFENEQNNG